MTDIADESLPDGSNVFRTLSARRRSGEASDEYPWVIDFGDRLPARFFALRLSGPAESDVRSGGPVDCCLIGLPSSEDDPASWRGGLAARCRVRLS